MTTDKLTIVSNDASADTNLFKKTALNDRFTNESDIEIKYPEASISENQFIEYTKERLNEGNVDAIYVTESNLLYKLLDSDIKFKRFDNAFSDLLTSDDYYKCFFKAGQIEKDDGIHTYALPTFVSPNVFLYRRSTFKQYFYTDDPTDVQAMISTLDDFSTISGEIKAEGQYASIIQDDIYEMYKGTRTEPWIIPTEDGNLECTVSNFVSNYLYYAKNRHGNGWDKFSQHKIDKWSQEWMNNFNDTYNPGDVTEQYLGFLAPTWEIKYTVAMICGDTYGDWAIAPGPLDTANMEGARNAHYILVPQTSKNSKSVCDFIRNITSDSDDVYNLCLNSVDDYVEGDIPDSVPCNKKLLNKLISNGIHCSFLGGEAYYPTFKQVLDAVENSTSDDKFYPSIYERDIDDIIKNNAYPYFIGDIAEDVAIENIENAIENLDSRIVFPS